MEVACGMFLDDELERAGAARLQTQMFATDHAYSDKRIALSRTLIDWLFRISGDR